MNMINCLLAIRATVINDPNPFQIPLTAQPPEESVKRCPIREVSSAFTAAAEEMCFWEMTRM